MDNKADAIVASLSCSNGNDAVHTANARPGKDGIGAAPLNVYVEHSYK
jgi:hypothetical protein